MKYNAYAKLNILLNVHGKYFNDYHSIESIMLPVNLYDELDIEIISGSSDIIIECSDKQIPQDENNILYKCAKLFQNKFKIRDGIKIYLHKNIPTQSGLGGESADAASLMHFYNDTYKLDLSFDSIFYLGRLLSWDVPICYLQKCIYINDKTNVCEVIVPKPPLYFLLIKPDFGISTKKAFEKLEYPVIFPVHPRIRKFIDRLMDKNHYRNICFVEPLGYLEMLYFTDNAIKVITDSGGLQKEAYIMHKNVVTLRNQTEWVETLEGNHNILCTIDGKSIIEAVQRTDIKEHFDDCLYGNGNAAEKMCKILF